MQNRVSFLAVAVSHMEDQSYHQMGGRVAGTGLPLEDCIVRCAEGKWPLTEVFSLGTLALWVEKCVDTALDPLVVSAHMGLSEVTLRGQPGGWDSDFQFHCLILFLVSNISGKR